jgi:hypothetical protein
MGDAPTKLVNAIRRRAILSPLDDTELGRAAGCGREHMNKFRNGRVGMGLKRLFALVEFFGGEVVVNWSQDEGEGRCEQSA